MKKSLIVLICILCSLAAWSENIVFADANVKALCVANWDTNGDGELSEAEAAAVTDLGTVFNNKTTITSFDELSYFTGLTSIGQAAFAACSGLTSVTIPNSVTSISNWAFRGCTGLTSITIPNSVTSIGQSAFQACSGLTSITIPNSVTSIGYFAFQECSGLTSLTIGNSVTSIGQQAFYGCSGLTSITIPNSVTSIGYYAFASCTSLTSITVESGNTVYDSRENSNAIIETSTNELIVGCKNTVIPNSVTAIGNNAFYGCSGLTSMTISNSVTSIGQSAFSGCSGLTSITVESGNTVYDSRENCNAIINTSTNELIVGCKNTIIPNSVTSIGEAAFEGCIGLTSVTIPNSVTSIGQSAFSGCRGLTSVNIPNSVTSIGQSAFSGCSGLTSVTIPNSVTSIGESTFKNCSGLTSVTIPNSVTSIGSYAFEACSGLTSLTIGNSVTSIGQQAFYGCSGLTSVTIPNSVTSIGDYAFWGCSLTSVTCLAENVPTTSSNAFISNYIQYATLLVPAGSVAAYQAAAPWSSFGNIMRCDDSGSCGDNVTYTFDATTGTLTISGTGAMTDYTNNSSRPWFSYRDAIKTVVVTDGVTSIGNHAFRDCSGLTSVTIGNSVTSIGNHAFRDCSGLTSVTIPNSVTSIGNYAFQACSGLTSVTIPNSVTSIGIGAFRSCNGLTSLTIPNSVTSIDSYAFSSCSGLTSITVESGNTVYDSRGNCKAIIKTSTNELIAGCKNTIIPNSVTSINIYAFCGCSGLTSVTIPNSVTSIGFGAFSNCYDLTSVTIPNSVMSIGAWAFYSCHSLTSVTIPNSVTSIGIGAFIYCSGLTSVVCLAKNVPTTDSNTFDSSNIGNITLYVPSGLVATYQAAAPWSGFGQITDQTDISQIDNVIYIEPFEARPGRAEREVSIKMKNTAAIRGFQFDLVLPEGVTPVTSGASIFRKLNNSRFPKDDFDERYHTLNISLQSDGSYRFLCGSTQDQTLIGNDGEIILLKVNIDENLAERDYPIILKNMKLTESDIDSYYETDVLLTKITVQNYEIGDISGDGVVDVSDYIGVANHILGNTPAGFNAQAADVNEDNAIDVSDYIGIANIILTGSIYGNSNNAAPAFEEDAELDPQ